MTHSRLVQDDSKRRADMLIRSNHLVQHIKLYSLFELKNGRWFRISSRSYSEQLAYRVFGDTVAKNIMGYSIRPIKIEAPAAQGISRFR